MTDEQFPRPIGTESNGYVWNGSAWVPRVDGSGSTFDGTTWHPPYRGASGSAAGPLQGHAFTDPRYGYGLTQRTSDDLQFIVRFHKVMIWIWIASIALVGIPMILFLFQLLALLTTLAARFGR